SLLTRVDLASIPAGASEENTAKCLGDSTSAACDTPRCEETKSSTAIADAAGPFKKRSGGVMASPRGNRSRIDSNNPTVTPAPEMRAPSGFTRPWGCTMHARCCGRGCHLAADAALPPSARAHHLAAARVQGWNGRRLRVSVRTGSATRLRLPPPAVQHLVVSS